MRFSIIIPAYNSAQYIEKALNSVKGQSFTDYELIVVCDSCTDNTVDVASKYADVVKVVNYHCDGLTRNAGIDIAQGDYILFMDDDDWFLHEFVLEELDKKLTERPDVDILCFSFIWRDWQYAQPKGNHGGYWIACWCKCWKRVAIGNTRFPNIERESDVYFHREMFHKGLKVETWDVPFYYYNWLREGSQTEAWWHG